MKIYVVSGTSGSGKSIALQSLEDIGFYCIDNLPIGMLTAFAAQLTGPDEGGFEAAAVGVDARNLGHDFTQFGAILGEIARMGLECEVFYLDAETPALLKRFSETRRRHPLTSSDQPLTEAIAAERLLLKPISAQASCHIDTTRTTAHQLREIIRDRVRYRHSQFMSLLFLSFGYKNGLPADTDFVFDIRCLPNPHWDPALRPLTGRDEGVAEFLERQPLVVRMREDIATFLDTWIPLFESENRSYMTVAIGCTGGQHRSVYMVESLARRYKEMRPNILIRHREIT
ncbi:MAG: hypothetical protein FD130_774 [Halothiobacillaceae bacterium]|nr:MAG: hypothetical protein FD130_774 [Halothiobacillaceae bacterium]